MQLTPTFEYLREPAKKYGTSFLVQEFASFAANATDEQLQELRAVYELIDARGDAFSISRWIDECFENRARLPRKEYDFSYQVGAMFTLFNYLASRAIEPFPSEKVAYVEILKKPNWDNLPKEFDYLIEPAEAYGVHESESDVLDFLDHAHPNDMETLARTAELIRLNGHSKLIDEWIREHISKAPRIVDDLLASSSHGACRIVTSCVRRNREAHPLTPTNPSLRGILSEMIGVGLFDESWPAKLPAEAAVRLKQLLDTPEP